MSMLRVTVMMFKERVESVKLEMELARDKCVGFLCFNLFCFLILLACCLDTEVASVDVVNLELAMLSLSSVSKKLVVSISLERTLLASSNLRPPVLSCWARPPRSGTLPAPCLRCSSVAGSASPPEPWPPRPSPTAGTACAPTRCMLRGWAMRECVAGAARGKRVCRA